MVTMKIFRNTFYMSTKYNLVITSPAVGPIGSLGSIQIICDTFWAPVDVIPHEIYLIKWPWKWPIGRSRVVGVKFLMIFWDLWVQMPTNWGLSTLCPPFQCYCPFGWKLCRRYSPVSKSTKSTRLRMSTFLQKNSDISLVYL